MYEIKVNLFILEMVRSLLCAHLTLSIKPIKCNYLHYYFRDGWMIGFLSVSSLTARSYMYLSTAHHPFHPLSHTLWPFSHANGSNLSRKHLGENRCHQQRSISTLVSLQSVFSHPFRTFNPYMNWA